MAWVEKDHNAHPVPTPCYVQGHQPPDQTAQSHIQPGLECLQGWGIHSLLGQPVQCVTTPWVKNFLLTSNLNLPCLSLKPFPLALSLSIQFFSTNSEWMLQPGDPAWKDEELYAYGWQNLLKCRHVQGTPSNPDNVLSTRMGEEASEKPTTQPSSTKPCEGTINSQV